MISNYLTSVLLTMISTGDVPINGTAPVVKRGALVIIPKLIINVGKITIISTCDQFSEHGDNQKYLFRYL
jgi:hypothetical protein